MMDNSLANRRRRGWIAPLISTVLTIPAGLFALAFGGLSPMACDSCDGAQAESFTRSFNTAFTVLLVGLAAAAVLLITSWCLTNDENAGRRGLFALLAPTAVLVSLVAFGSLVEWPS